MQTQETNNADEFEPRLTLRTITSDGAIAEKIIPQMMSDVGIKGRFLDALILVVRGDQGAQITLTNQDGQVSTGGFSELTVKVSTNFFPYDQGVFCEYNNEPFGISIRETIEGDGGNWEEWREWLETSNDSFDIKPSQALAKKIKETNDSLNAVSSDGEKSSKSDSQNVSVSKVSAFAVHTGQEMDALFRSGADGTRRIKWRKDSERGREIWEEDGGPYRVEVYENNGHALDEEILTVDALTALISAQDSDFPLAALYVCGILAPTTALPSNRLASATVDLNDLMEKIGWCASSPGKAEREIKRARLYKYLVYGARAVVVGQRTVSYKDRQTGELIPTRLESAPWQIMARRYPDQEVLFGERPAPLTVELALSKEWERLLLHPDAAQYLPFGEILGSIPPDQPSGAFARAIGLGYMRQSRMKPREILSGKINPTRERLLTCYAPKTKYTLDEYLKSSQPRRVVEYYRDGLGLIAETGLIAYTGDAARDVTVKSMLAPYLRQGWGPSWKQEASGLKPGPKLLPEISRSADAQPVESAPKKRHYKKRI